MAKPDAWMPMYWREFWADTQSLSAVEQCAYFNLLGAAWMNGGSLPDDNDRLQRLSRVTVAEWDTASGTVTAFFERRDGRLFQKRLTEEYEKASKSYAARVTHINAVNDRKRQSLSSVTVADTDVSRSTTTHNSQVEESKIQPSAVAVATTAPEILPAGEQKPELVPMSLKDRLFGSCLAWLTAKTDLKPTRARTLIGGFIKEFGEGATLEAINAAEKESAVDPVAFIRACLANKSGRRKPGGNGSRSGSVVDIVAELIAETDLAGSAHGRGMGRGGDGVSADVDDGGSEIAGTSNLADLIESDDAERMLETYGRLEALDRKSWGTRKRRQGADAALRESAPGLPGGRGEERTDDSGADIEVVASMGGSGGAPGAADAPPPQIAGSDSDGDDYGDLPAFLDKRPKREHGESETDLLRRILGDGPEAKRTIGEK